MCRCAAASCAPWSVTVVAGRLCTVITIDFSGCVGVQCNDCTGTCVYVGIILGVYVRVYVCKGCRYVQGAVPSTRHLLTSLCSFRCMPSKLVSSYVVPLCTCWRVGCRMHWVHSCAVLCCAMAALPAYVHERLLPTRLSVYATSRLCACTCFVVCVLRPPGWLHMQRSGVYLSIAGGSSPLTLWGV